MGEALWCRWECTDVLYIVSMTSFVQLYLVSCHFEFAFRDSAGSQTPHSMASKICSSARIREIALHPSADGLYGYFVHLSTVVTYQAKVETNACDPFAFPDP